MIKHKYYPEDRLIMAIFCGTVVSQELHDFVDKLVKIDKNEEGMRGLVVLCSNVKASGIDYNQIFSAGQKMQQAKFRKNGKNAIVAKTLLGYGLSRMYQVASEVTNLDELKVYKENGLEEAIDWLGVGNMSNQIQEQLDFCESIAQD